MLLQNYSSKIMQIAHFVCDRMDKMVCFYTKVAFELSVDELLFSFFLFGLRERGLTFLDPTEVVDMSKHTLFEFNVPISDSSLELRPR